MNLPTKITVFRLVLTPFFFLFFFLPDYIAGTEIFSVIGLVLVFILIEVSDVLDGYLARKWNIVTELGKVLDPFADVLSRLTYMICFYTAGIMPLVFLVLIIYRELSITFLRMVMMGKGRAMAANFWGKLKAIFYAISGIVGILLVTILKLDLFSSIHEILIWIGIGVFGMAALASVASFVTYAVQVKTLLQDKKSS